MGRTWSLFRSTRFEKFLERIGYSFALLSFKMPGVCPRCSKQVYFAEEKKSLGKSWHKMCFSCSQCKKMLEAGSEREHDNEVYCKTCHGRNFGPKGYGYGGGAGTLSMESARK